MENDLIQKTREFSVDSEIAILTPPERKKAQDNLSRRPQTRSLDDELELLHGLDLGDKFNILMRLKSKMSQGAKSHYLEIKKHFDKIVPVRNTVMHGRPLTFDDYSKAFLFTELLLQKKEYWPNLYKSYENYKSNPQSIVETSIRYLENFDFNEPFNNLPQPDYDDTGFFPRPKLEKELKRKILSRHPVVTVLGDGGDGKTAITLQTLYDLLSSGDHDFDAIIWISAKSSRLATREIKRIETAITSSISAFDEVAKIFEDSKEDPKERVRTLLKENKILLVIDNLETILDKTIRDFAEEIPGESKLVLTSRVPLGSDLPVHVEPFNQDEAVTFLRNLISTYDIGNLRKEKEEKLRLYATRLHNKPLLLKWFALGVKSGLSPSSIVSSPEDALRFCLENVFEALSAQAKKHLAALSVLPRAVSLGVLQHVTKEDIRLLENSLVELMNFAIVTQESENRYETVYQIKPLAKAYLVRVLKAKHSDSEEILKNFRQIEGIYQNERGNKLHDRYNPICYIVRTKSEALAVKNLRYAVRLAQNDDIVASLSLIDELKVSNPDYFEIYRTEAYISTLSGDNNRAHEAHLTALELGENQPQLHLFYGTFLVRTYSDYDAAVEQFKKAVELDEESIQPLIETSRTYMYLLDFDLAQEYLDRSLKKKIANYKTPAFLCDLQVQIYYRKIELSKKNKNRETLIEATRDLTVYIETLNVGVIDDVVIRHLRKCYDLVNSFNTGFQNRVSKELDLLEVALQNFFKKAGIPQLSVSSTENHLKFGRLKNAGRKPSFGFLVDTEGNEAFIHRSNVEPEIWIALNEEKYVQYEIVLDEQKRPRATNVSLTQ